MPLITSAYGAATNLFVLGANIELLKSATGVWQGGPPTTYVFLSSSGSTLYLMPSPRSYSPLRWLMTPPAWAAPTRDARRSQPLYKAATTRATTPKLHGRSMRSPAATTTRRRRFQRSSACSTRQTTISAMARQSAQTPSSPAQPQSVRIPSSPRLSS